MKRITTIKFAAGVLATLAFTSAAFAHEGHDQHADMRAPAAVAAMSSGEVKKVDKGVGKITIKHGPLKNLDMPPMTMIFKVQEPAMLDDIKVGDKVDFIAEKRNGNLTLTRLEASK